MLGTRRRLVGVLAGVGASPQHPVGELAADRSLRGAAGGRSGIPAHASLIFPLGIPFVPR